MLARALEAHGIATTSISLVREHTAKITPPRALFVDGAELTKKYPELGRFRRT